MASGKLSKTHGLKQRSRIDGIETSLPLDQLRFNFQPPGNLIERTVSEYVERFRTKQRVEPVEVRFDGANYFLYDGFHRVEAARRTGRTHILANVSPGTLEDMEREFQSYLKALKQHLAERPHD